jgi:hypothetical protein
MVGRAACDELAVDLVFMNLEQLVDARIENPRVGAF